MAAKVWFITGTSRGFGREWAIAALERGDKVTATARDTVSLRDLADKYGDAVAPARPRRHRPPSSVRHGRPSPRPLRQTRCCGQQRGIRPVRHDRGAQRAEGARPALSQALAQEVAAFGIKVTLIEPAAYDTDWGGSSASHATPLPAYDAVRKQAAEQRARRVASPGKPEATREAILQVVDAERPPLRVFFGNGPLGIATADYESRLATWREWEQVSVSAHGEAG
jgi:NAD(P)-dependent dehydrogenase (short-subunit alcohol dehydrogenase family)